MSTVPTHVPAFEHGRLRLWSFDGESEAGRALIAGMSEEPRDAGTAMTALGAERVDPYWLDLVRLADIKELGLAGYLAQGYDVPQEQLSSESLSTPHDHVLIAPSRAFADHEQTLTPDPALAPLAVIDLHEDVGALRPMEPVGTARRDQSAATEPPEPAPGPPAGRGLRAGAILILLVVAAAFIALVAL